jgi:hypothetical protein
MSTDTYQVDVPEGREGAWSIKKFTVSKEEGIHDAVMSMFGGSGRHVPAGTYTGLYRGAEPIMTDTPDEIRDHRRFMRTATGNVMIAGLGLGMVLQGCARRDDVKSVTVIELSKDVIKLVEAHYKAKPYGHKITVINADIFDWKPAKGVKFDHAWFDIWDGLCTDNLDEMAKLNRRFARICPNKGSWGREFLLDRRRREKDAPWNWSR